MKILAILKELAGAPDEFQLLPDGKIEIEGDAPAYLDEGSAASIIGKFKGRGNDMVIDYEHQTMKEMKAPAAGWIRDLIYKGKEGLWAKAEWTERAKEYLKNREYRYFSPVFWTTIKERKVVKIENVALTNSPKINNLKPIMAKMDLDGNGQGIIYNKKEGKMLEKLKKILKLAEDDGEDKVVEAIEAVIAKNDILEAAQKAGGEIIACKEVLDALGAKEADGKDDLIKIIAAIKAPADAAGKLSLEVARLTKEISGMKQADLIQLALKEGKTSPEELDTWGRDLALKSPDQFEKIVLSRPAGSVIPVERIALTGDEPGKGSINDATLEVAKMMGVEGEDIKKYGGDK